MKAFLISLLMVLCGVAHAEVPARIFSTVRDSFLPTKSAARDSGWERVETSSAVVTKVLHPLSPDLMYAISNDGKMLYSIHPDGATQLGTLPENGDHVFGFSASDRHRIYFAGNALWSSTDDGRTWTSLAQHPDAEGRFIAVHEGFEAGTLLAADARGHLFLAKGGSLSEIPMPRGGRLVKIVDSGETGLLYLAYSASQNQEAQIFRLSSSFRSSPVYGLPNMQLSSIAVEPGDARRIYAAGDRGLWVSLDAGQTWAQEDMGTEEAIASLSAYADQDVFLLSAVGVSGTVYKAAAATVCTFNVSPTAIQMGGGATSTGVKIDANSSTCSWRVTESLPWLSASKRSGRGDAEITLRVTANSTSRSRTSSAIRIAGKSVTVTQAAGCQISLSPRVMAINTPGYYDLDIQSCGSWAATGIPPWLTLSRTSHSRAAKITVKAAATDVDREATLTIAGLSFTVRQVVTGSGGGLTVVPPAAPFRTVTTAAPMSGAVGQTIELKAVVNFGTGNSPGPNQVRFTVNGRVVEGDANVLSGVALKAYKIPDSVAPLHVSATFLANQFALTSSASFRVTVSRSPVLFVMSVGNDTFGRPTLNVRMTRTTDGLPLSGKRVTLFLDGQGFATVTTDSKGTASARYPVPPVCRKELPFRAQYLGDSLYLPTTTDWIYYSPFFCTVTK